MYIDTSLFVCVSVRSVIGGRSSYRRGAYLSRYDRQRPRDTHLRENIVRTYSHARNISNFM